MSTPSERKRSRPDQPALFEVAGDPPPAPKLAEPARGKPRLRTANREQIVFRAAPLDALIPEDHAARVIWTTSKG